MIIFRNIAFLVALIAVTAGCAMERPSLGFIVPGLVVMLLAASAYLAPVKERK